jgi:lysozyme family protein
MNFPETFLYAMAFLFQEEGGTNTDPLDRGGFTNFGLSEKQYPHLDLKNITREQALEIYYTDYWLSQRCHMFLSPIALALFDSSVNCGPKPAAKWLQKSINHGNNFVDVDGIIGTQTILAATGPPPYKVAGGLVGYRLMHYADLVDRHPEQVRFIKGWIRRASRLLNYI